MIIAFYDLLSGNKIEQHAQLSIKQFQQILHIDSDALNPHITIPIVHYFEASANINDNIAPASSINAGLQMTARCLELSPGLPICIEIESRLHSAQALWLKKQGRPYLAELELASRLSKQALLKMPDEQDVLLDGTEIAYQLAEAQLEQRKRPTATVQAGLTSIDRALANAAGLPRALALRGALLSLRGKLEKDRAEKRATLQAAQAALAESFAGNPLLRRRYEGTQKELETLLAGL